MNLLRVVIFALLAIWILGSGAIALGQEATREPAPVVYEVATEGETIEIVLPQVEDESWIESTPLAVVLGAGVLAFVLMMGVGLAGTKLYGLAQRLETIFWQVDQRVGRYAGTPLAAGINSLARAALEKVDEEDDAIVVWAFVNLQRRMRDKGHWLTPEDVSSVLRLPLDAVIELTSADKVKPVQ